MGRSSEAGRAGIANGVNAIARTFGSSIASAALGTLASEKSRTRSAGKQVNEVTTVERQRS